MLPITMRRAPRDKALGRPAQTQVLYLWSCLCVIHVLISTKQLGSVELDVLWMYWQPVIPPLFMLWLWGAAVRRFTQLSIDYDQCFAAKDRKYLLEGTDIQRVAMTLFSLAMTGASLYCMAASSQLFLAAEFMPLLLYCGLGGVVLMPLAVLHRPTRHFFAYTCTRVLVPLQEVSWADFLLADIFCSLSKSSADMTSALCHSATGPVMQSLIHRQYTPSALCSPQSPLMLAAPCLPYAIRFIQCLIVNRTTGSPTQLFNAAKYLSAFPAVVLTVWEHEAHVHDRPFKHRDLWLATVAFNTAYSFYWDVEQDWDMPWIVAARRRQTARGAAGDLLAGGAGPQVGTGKQQLRGWLPSLRPDALYPPRWYAWALVSNLVLRCAWMHRLMGNLENSRSLSLLLACAETWRRYQWSFIRVETELRKIAARSASVMSLDTLTSGPLPGGAPAFIAGPQATGQQDNLPPKATPLDVQFAQDKATKQNGVGHAGAEGAAHVAMHGSGKGAASPSKPVTGSNISHRVHTGMVGSGGGQDNATLKSYGSGPFQTAGTS